VRKQNGYHVDMEDVHGGSNVLLDDGVVIHFGSERGRTVDLAESVRLIREEASSVTADEIEQDKGGGTADGWIFMLGAKQAHTAVDDFKEVGAHSKWCQKAALAEIAESARTHRWNGILKSP
jgi:hypothetical protein